MIWNKDLNYKRQLIMDHYLNPRNFDNKKIISNSKIVFNNCGDKLIYDFEFTKNRLIKATFQGQGCAIAIASTDLMLSLVKDQELDQIKALLDDYQKMLTNLSSNSYQTLGSLNVFHYINKQPNRIECALLVSNAINQVLKLKIRL